MNNIKDLMKLKTIGCDPFENAYEELIMSLEDYYIAKSDGVNRMKFRLQDWDEESQLAILNEVANRIEEVMTDLNREEFMSNFIMKRMLKCFAEEYTGKNGLCVRLREKETKKHISICASNQADKLHLLKFLSQAVSLRKMAEENGYECYLYHSTKFDSNGGDYICVEGNILVETEESIELAKDDDLGYCYK